MNTVIVNGINVTEELEKLKELHIKQTKLLEMYKESYELLKEVIVKTGSTRKEWARLKELEKEIEELK